MRRDDYLENRVIWKPAEMTDEFGKFIVVRYWRGFLDLVPEHYKRYSTGHVAEVGIEISITKKEYDQLIEADQKEWGYVDSNGDFVPGRQGYYFPRGNID
jgi:hypothetical protein